MTIVASIGDMRDARNQELLVHTVGEHVRVISGGPTIMLSSGQTLDFIMLLLKGLVQTEAKATIERQRKLVQNKVQYGELP